MNNNKINILGWMLFIVSAVGFIISSIGNFWECLEVFFS